MKNGKARLNYAKVARGGYDAKDPLDQYLDRCGLESSLLHLVRLRASQINGCAYCISIAGRLVPGMYQPVSSEPAS